MRKGTGNAQARELLVLGHALKLLGRPQEASPYVAESQRYHLCFALGRALEERGE